MAWTAPRTWVDGELVTASIMNTHVRDNELALGPHLIARRTADQTVSASTAFVDDDTLQLTVAANEVWQVSCMLRLIHSTSGNFKYSWSFPASGTMYSTGVGLHTDATTFVLQQEITATDGGSGTFICQTTARMPYIEGLFINAGTAGTLKLRWAQNTANGTTTNKAQSTLWAVKLA